jgi:molybdopterin-guanine dinucleotide biosynthesis protein B
MKIFGLAGWSGSGKTTLMEGLVKAISRRGLAVSTIKHAHHGFDIDRPGKDSHRHREAGAREVMLASGLRWVLMHELRDAPEPEVEDLVARMQPVDLLLIEGFKFHAHDKIEVHRPDLGKPMLWPGDPGIVAVASDQRLEGLPVPLLDLDDHEAAAAFVLARVGLG